MKEKIYNNGNPISQNEYNRLMMENKLDKDLLYVVKPSLDPLIDATNKWTSLSNAIIQKYKALSESNPDSAVAQLSALRDILLEVEFFEEEDFKNW